jgi:hypothetical protein
MAFKLDQGVAQSLSAESGAQTGGVPRRGAALTLAEGSWDISFTRALSSPHVVLQREVNHEGVESNTEPSGKPQLVISAVPVPHPVQMTSLDPSPSRRPLTRSATYLICAVG